VNEYLFQASIFAAAGVFFLWGAKPLSLQYNAWTTGLRERHPNINPPPTTEQRTRNTKIMTSIFRFLGVFFLLFSTVPFLAFIGSVHKPH
jgi:hypothetical protein